MNAEETKSTDNCNDRFRARKQNKREEKESEMNKMSGWRVAHAGTKDGGRKMRYSFRVSVVGTLFLSRVD
jgi:hypothetical protein